MNKKRLVNVSIFLGLLSGMLLFSTIPVLLFNIPYDKFNIIGKAIYNFICDIIFIGFVFWLYRDKIITDFKNYFQNFRDNFEKSFKYYFIGAIVMVVSNLIITLCFTNATAGNEETVRKLIGEAPLYMLFSVSIYAPFVEEMVFRHGIRKWFNAEKKNKLSKYLFALTTGFIFALLHILGRDSSIIDYVYIVPYMSLGCAFGLLYYETDNIFSSITMHALHNTATVILLFMSGGIL